MDWMNQLGGLLQQYAGASARNAPPQAEEDFERVAQSAPPEMLSRGLAESFRSNETPPFQNMLATLFGRSDSNQRASILNTLIGAAGPALLSGGLGRLASRGSVTPEEAEKVEPEEVVAIAKEAEQRDPNIVDRISDIYAQNPTLFKTLGAAAVAIAMSKMAKQERGLF